MNYNIDPNSGEITEKRKSPRKGNEYQIFLELYKIKPYLKKEHFTIRIVLLDVEEYKLLDGWGKQKKNNASKYDRIPLLICKETVIERIEDYMQFIPYQLQDHFTSKSFAKAAHIPPRLATVVLNVLDHMEVVERIGKEGKAYVYRVREV